MTNIGIPTKRPAGKLLTDIQISDFVTDGYTIVRDAFSATVAAQVCDRLWDKLADRGVYRDNPQSWIQQLVSIQETYDGSPFADAWSDKLVLALNDLLGEGRYTVPQSLGWWPVSFPGHEPPPWASPVKGWHIDGIHFHHHVDGADQGLLPLFILSDIQQGGGGTAVAARSHVNTARVLAAAEPDGLDAREVTRRVLEFPIENVRELYGNPFLLHARSPNTLNSVRFICNPCIALRQKMDLHRANPSDYSPVELAIVNSLGN
jgi:hypothetical protein